MKNNIFFIIFFFYCTIQIINSYSTSQSTCYSNFISGIGGDPNQNDYCNIKGITCDDNLDVIEISAQSLSPLTAFSSSLIKCFTQLQKITFIDFMLDIDFLTNSNYYNTQNSYEVNLINPKDYTIGQITTSIKILTISTNTVYTKTNIIPLDYFVDLDVFIWEDNTGSGNQVVSFSPQTAINTNFKLYKLFSSTLPNLGSISNINHFEITLQNSPSWTGLDSYSNIDVIIIKSYNPEINCFPFQLIEGTTPMMTTYLELDLCLSTAGSREKLNMSKYFDNLSTLSISSSKTNFVTKDFFFSQLPSKLEVFTLKSSQFYSLLNAYQVLRGIREVYLNNNSLLSPDLPSNEMTPGVNVNLDISSNGLSGQLYDTYCTVQNIDISNNSLTGILPDCYLCHYPLINGTIDKRLAGNQFSNYGDLGNCENKIIPTLLIENKKLVLRGKNLGFSNEFNVSPQIYFSMDTPNQLFFADYSYFTDRGLGPQVFTFYFYTPKKSFTLRAIQLNPVITKVTTQTTNVTIDGSEFSYDKSNVMVKIGSYDCIVVSSSYYQINCTLEVAQYKLVNDMITYVTIVDPRNTSSPTFTTQITVSFNSLGDLYENNIQMCTNDCNNNGICYTNNATCVCNQNIFDQYCGVKTCKDNCNSRGVCIFSTGICSCNLGYDGDTCEYLQCPNNCSNAGTCTRNTGICQCFTNRTLHDCSGFKCPNNCSNTGECNFSTGQCSCNSDRVFDDCSGIKCPTCENNGKCNYSTGTCQCTANWKDSNCTTPIHYISSVEPCSTNGGSVIIHGWFGTVHKDLTITIGALPCTFTDSDVTESTINCTLAAGQGTKNVNVTQNGSSYIGKNIFQYLSTIIPCPNNCSNNGQCDTSNGQCFCTSQYTGFDCSSPIPTTSNNNNQLQEIPKSETTVDINKGSASISNQDTNYEISIISLIELNINGDKVREIPLQNKWSNIINSSNNSIYQFSQNITIDDDNEESSSSIFYTIEEIKDKSKKYEYAGLTLNIDQGSVKVSVNISNYPYINGLNTLQLRFISSADNSNTTPIPSNQCNIEESESDTSNVDPNQTLNYISIVKNSKKLSGRFINKVISDGRATFMSLEVVKDLSNSSTIVIGLNLPHCTSTCLIDPDFSVLVTSNFKSKCDTSDSKKNWIVPVAVVIPTVVVAALVLGGILLYKKHRYSVQLFLSSKHSGKSFRDTFKLKRRKSKLYGYEG